MGELPWNHWLERLQIALTALCLLFLGVSWVPGYEGLAYVSVACGSLFAIRSGLQSIQEKVLDVNFLMILAAVAAVAIGAVRDAAALLFLFSLSGTLETFALGRTRSAIESLVKLRPEKAIKITGSGDVSVPVLSLEPGDHVRVGPFEPIPLDGLIVDGASSLDESSMTGESVPRDVMHGDKVLGGTHNQAGTLVVQVTAKAEDSTLDKIVSLVREAQENKAGGERISAWFGQRYTVFVLFAFMVALGVRLATGSEWSSAIYASTVLLVALSPCALVISAPAATLSAMAWTGRRGILVRGGAYIEAAGLVDWVATDKTGTLTAGRPRLLEICVPTAQLAEVAPAGCVVCLAASGCHCMTCWHAGEALPAEAHHLLRLTAAAETGSTHPLAQAVIDRAKEYEIVLPADARHTMVPGRGIEAEVEGKWVRIGRREFFKSEGDLPSELDEHVDEMESRGLTAVLVRHEHGWGALGLQDTARPEARQAIRELRSEGVEQVVLLSGDNQRTANAVAEELELDRAIGSLLPEDKAAWIREAQADGKTVMMVGDGVNDAPALVSAHLGVAMGGLGSDVALRSSDVVLAQDRLDRLPDLVRIGKKCRRIIRANLMLAAGMILVLTIASFVTVLPLPIAVLGHEGSTVLVILNGLRLLRGP